jgi:hypothetical protein
VLGNRTGFQATSDQIHDLNGADAYLSGAPAGTVIAGKAYDAW